MAGAGLSWVSLSPSRERRHWLFGAVALSVILALLFGAGAAIAPALALWAAAGSAALSAGLSLHAAQRAVDPMRLAIDADGVIWLRRGKRLDTTSGENPDAGADDVPPERLQPRLAGDRVVTFSSANGPVLVWRDSLPADAFRRLSTHARWHVERASRQPQVTP